MEFLPPVIKAQSVAFDDLTKNYTFDEKIIVSHQGRGHYLILYAEFLKVLTLPPFTQACTCLDHS